MDQQQKQQQQNQPIKDTDIAVIGIGFRLPGDFNNEPKNLWNNLRNGFNSVKEIPSDRMSKNYSILGQTNSGKASLLDFNDIKNFDPLFFGISPEASSSIDPQERISLIATYEALEDSYLDPIELRGSNTSVFMGTYSMDYKALQNTETHSVNSAIRCIANRISYCFDFRGQSISMDTACSASSNSIISGCKTLIDGTSNISVCGGANIILDSNFWKSISFEGMDSKSGYSHSFSSSADGFGRGEGCAVVILKRMVDAISDGNKIYCIIKGFSSNIDGNFGKQSFFAPSINGQNTNIKLAFKSTNGTILPSDIYYVETHGTGTPVGDPIELESISKAFDTPTSRSSTYPLFIGSIKSNIGHSEAASGVVSLIKCALMFKHRILTPNYNFKQGNPRINFKDWNLKVVTEIQEFPKQNKPISMMINNFGATGSNCCFILSEYINNNNMERNNNVDKDIEYLIPFSANSKKSIDTYKRLIVENYLGTMEFNEFFVKQVFTKTTKLGQRSVIVSKPDWSGFNNLDNHYSTISNTPSNITRSIEPTIVFIFPGQGSQFNRMGIELYEKSKLFRDSMNEINELFKPLYGYSILDKLRSIDDNDKNEIHLPSIVHPSMVMIQISLFKLLKNHWNINPSFIVGHSFGEFAAAYCSGMIDSETCTQVVYIRSKLQDKLVGSGKMLSISISEDNFNCNYSSQYPNVEISCYNSNNSIVVSGSEQDLTKLSNELKSKSIFNILLGTNVAYHSSIQNVIKDDLISNIGIINNNKPTTPIFSTVTGELFGNDNDLSFTAEYAYKNSRQPVLFKQAITNLYKHIEENNIGNGLVTFIEITPHPVLSFYLNELKPSNDSNYFTSSESISILQTLNRKNSDIKEIQKLISTLYCQGYNVNFKCQFNNGGAVNSINDLIDVNSKNNNIDLPRYQWDLKPYWYESKESYKNRIEGPPITIYGNSNDLTSPLISKTTFIDISKEPFKWLKGHMVKDRVLFPGAGYIDIILNILKNQDAIFIDHLEFKLPFILSDRNNLELTTNITPSESDKRNAYFHIKDQKSNEWVCSSRGIISTEPKKHDISQDTGMMDIENKEIIYDIETIKSQNNFTHLFKDDLYNYIARITSITYNDCFKRVEECWIGNNTSLIKVSTSKLISNNDNQMFLNASIIDCCFHGFLVLLKDQCSLVFENFKGFKLNCLNLPLKVSSSLENNNGESFIYVLAKQTDSYSNSFAGSIVAFLENGKVLFEIEELVCTSTNQIVDSTEVEYPNNEIYSYYNESKDSLICDITPFKHIYEMDCFKTINQIEKEEEEKENNLSLILTDIVSNSIKPILHERMVFRILELNGGNNLIMSKNILQSIDRILNHNQHLQQNSNILIEYTISNYSAHLISSIDKDELLRIISNKMDVDNPNISILFKTINLDIHFSSQSYRPSHYDLIIFSNVLNTSKDIVFNIDQFHCLLKSNGHLLFTDTQIHSEFTNNLLETISNHKGFINTISTHSMNSDTDVDFPFIIHTNKKSLLSTETKSDIITGYNIIFYSSVFKQTSSSINSFIDSITSNGLFKNRDDNNYTIISSFDQFKNQNISDSEKSIIFFLPAIEPLSSDNFNEVSLELFKVYQLLTNENKLKCKLAVISTNSNVECNYFYNSSVLGVMKYFSDKFSTFSFDYDMESISNNGTVNSTINQLLLNSGNHIQVEYFIRKNKVYYEIFYKESIEKRFSKRIEYQRQQFNETMYVKKLNSFLEFESHLNQTNLKSNEIEIKVMSTGINQKDNLIYLDLISSNGNEMSFGNECSGVVTRVGVDVKEFKVGDNVFGLANSTTSSHVIVNEKSNVMILKPDTIDHSTASSIPFAYLTSYYSIFNIGNFIIQDNQSILIHSACSSLGVSALNILKWKGHKSFVFVTVSTIEKEQYLIDEFGDFITGIYSSTNSNFVGKIKSKLKQLGSKKDGVDLIINTNSNNVKMDSNFDCLCQNGRIVDLSIHTLDTTITSVQDKYKNKYIGYQRMDINYLPIDRLKSLLKEITNSILNDTLQLNNQITSFSIENIKDAFELMNKRSNIYGKIICEMDYDYDNNKIISNDQLTKTVLNKSNYKLNSLGKTVLVTGQTGIILEVLKWIIAHSTTVENIIIFSYSELKWELKLLINQTLNIKTNNIKFYFKSVDVGSIDQLSLAIDSILNENKQTIENVDSIFHFAFKMVSTSLNQIELSDFKRSTSSKSIGAINFHNISIERNWNLKNFVLSSSIGSVLNSNNSPTYCVSNNMLDSLSRYRKSIGLQCTSINLGVVRSTGTLSGSNKLINHSMSQDGLIPIKTNKIFGSLDLLLGGNDGNGSGNGSIGKNEIDLNLQSIRHNCMYYSINLKESLQFLKNNGTSYKNDYYTNQSIQLQSLINSKNGVNDEINKNSDSYISQHIIDSISEYLSIEKSLINIDFKIIEYGSDSLLTSMFKNYIEKEFSISITIKQIQSLPIKSIIKFVIKSISE